MSTPIINMPGCVTAHEKSGDNKNVVDDDPKGAKVFCDGQTPSFDPIQYEPENLTIEQSAPVPTVYLDHLKHQHQQHQTYLRNLSLL